MYYVADTHAFLWYLADSPQLSRAALAIFDLAERGETVIIIPAVVLLESIGVLDKKKLALDFEAIVLKIESASNFTLSEVNLGLILEVNRTKGLRDLHDRVIVATAKLSDAALISKDKIIRSFYPNTVW